MARASNFVGKLTSGWNAVDPGSHGIVWGFNHRFPWDTAVFLGLAVRFFGVGGQIDRRSKFDRDLGWIAVLLGG